MGLDLAGLGVNWSLGYLPAAEIPEVIPSQYWELEGQAVQAVHLVWQPCKWPEDQLPTARTAEHPCKWQQECQAEPFAVGNLGVVAELA